MRMIHGDCLEIMQGMEAESVNCCVTSPPYWGLRDYGIKGQLGLEKTPEEYTEKLVKVFREVKRVLKPEGTLWLNLGDCYNAAGRKGHGTRTGVKQGTNRASRAGQDNSRPHARNLKPKDLVGIPWRVAFALQADGWYLRQDIIWAKPNPMPESVTDRCTKSHEYIFLLSKNKKYYYDNEAIKEPIAASTLKDNRRNVKGYKTGRPQRGYPGASSHGAGLLNPTCTTRNKRSVWAVTPKPFKGAHFATFPPDLIAPCILAGCPKNGTVLDPFGGAGTTGIVALEQNKKAILIELSPEYLKIAKGRINLAITRKLMGAVS